VAGPFQLKWCVTLRGISAPQQIGRYEILEQLGRGAMGVVFKGRDPFIGRLVAVKTITTGVADNPELLARFRREAQAAGGLQHPNIVTIYEMSEFEGTPFIAMEYLGGATLEKMIAEQAQLPLVDKIGYLVQSCRALDYAHRRGVIHRDVKPANIMVTSEGFVKVVDFGIARIVDTAKTQTGVLLGTLSYMSPEQVRGQHADERCDVWALGVVMYELLAYRRPFVGENHAALLMCILQQEPRAIRELLPECPLELENVVQRALRKEEALRYPSMEALLVDLEPIWTSLQKEEVQKLVSQGRELMEGGRLEEASEVLRKSLSFDTGNAAAKALFDQVNAKLEANSPRVAERKPSTADQNRMLEALARADQAAPGYAQGGTVADAKEFNPQMTRGIEPRGTIFATTPSQVLRSDRAGQSTAGQGDSTPKSVPPSPATPQSPIPSLRQGTAAQTSARPRRRAFIFAAAAFVVAFLLLGAVGFLKYSARQNLAYVPHFTLAPPTPPEIQPAPPAAPEAPASVPVAVPAAIPAPALVSAAPPPAAAVPATKAPAKPLVPARSVKDQQRDLIDQAHEAADSKDYKSAEARLAEAAKLNGPLNTVVADLRREISDEAHNTELREAAQQEQGMWTRAMNDFDAGRYDDSDKTLRELLLMPEAARHWAEAAKYVDELIPARRKGEQLWVREQQEAGLTGAGHRLNEVKILDQALETGGVHQQEARQKRDTLLAQFARENRRRNNQQGSGVSAPEQAKLPKLKDEVDEAVARGDSKALGQLMEMRPRFKSIVDGGGPLVPDARDYMNNILPKAQKAIEANLANAEADTLSNAKFRDAAKQFDQAVAAQNAKLLRSQIQSEFQVIVSSGGPRVKEAQRYIEVLIPEALEKISR
jgi:serine/threonine protein kinase